ncbi:PLC-like phosphodiesterase [Piromyces finnis]|uniref:PLC-like phosphodiesterase n=1 Tax=Piromyces finnis TaxID=1754191 RepID=A0A1Y1VFB1_9FUNG|nr:PLC-like phosphodiesterase [Piromyces finnis]|eukprot:ORX54173.1 PLC-like phosphodiesterase [Piromyces finnis]
MNKVPYYDIDLTTKRALTEYRWCTLKINDDDIHWITKITDDYVRINQLNIPGTHDSGTYAIGDTGVNFLDARVMFGRTQELNIFEQMMNGIRYFDIRIKTNKNKEIYLSHDVFDCMNRDTGKKYYLEDVFDEAIEFLGNNSGEAIIMHLKDDDIQLGSTSEYHDYMHGEVHTVKIDGFESKEEVYKAIANLSILKTDSTSFSKSYKDFFYSGKESFPKLGDVSGKIVLLTRGQWMYGNKKDEYLGSEINISDMGSCKEYPDSDKEDMKKCYSHIHNTNQNILVQDNYNLQTGKPKLVQDLLDHKVPIILNTLQIMN